MAILWKPRTPWPSSMSACSISRALSCVHHRGRLAQRGEEAARRKSGARGLRAILEEVMLDVMYEIPSLSG